MRPYRALFLDIDDTVLDYAQCGGQALAETCRRMGAVCTEEVAARFWAIDARVWAEQKRGVWTIDQVLDRRAQEMADLLGMPEKAGLFRYGFVEALGRTAVPVAGAAALLDRLRARGMPVYGASNGFLATQQRRLRLAGLLDRFADLFVSDDVGAEKPDPVFFRRALARAGRDAAEVLMIGDSYHADVLGGASAGLDTCWFCRGAADRPPVWTYLVRSLEEIDALL